MNSIDPSDEEYKDIIKKRKAKVGNTNGSCYAMQNTVFPNKHTGNRCSKNNKSQSARIKEEIQLYWHCRGRTEFYIVFVKVTPQMTRFRDAKVSNNLATDEIDDHRIQSDYKCKSELHKSRRKELYPHLVLRLRGETEHDTNDNVTIKGIASAWWNRARHQWQRDHQDPEHLPHKAHEHWHVKWMCAQFSSLFMLVRFLSS